MLATAEQGITRDDVPALLKFLSAPRGSERQALDRLGDYILGLDIESRENIAKSSYYGNVASAPEDQTFFLRTPDQRRLWHDVLDAPESAWPKFRELLTTAASNSSDEFFVDHLLEHLIDQHADAFIDRLEVLIKESEIARDRVAAVYVEGQPVTLGVERLWALQARLRDKLTIR